MKILRILNSHSTATNKLHQSNPQPRNVMQPFGVPQGIPKASCTSITYFEGLKGRLFWGLLMGDHLR